jgi:hypothetical protein
LTELADRSGFTKAIAVHGGVWNLGAYPRPRCGAHPLGSRHDGWCRLPGRLGALREHDELFGPVASIVTAWRAVEATAAPGLRAIPPAVAAARAKVWTESPPGVGWETTNEPLAAMLRPGNAESNDADHHLELLDRAIDGLPAVYQADHDVGDHTCEVDHPILVRADSAGATHGFVLGSVESNCDYSIGYPIDGRVWDALQLVQEEDRCQAIETDGSIRDGAWVVELTDLVDPSAWPEGTRLIMRRERPHPEAPLTLTDSVEVVDQPTPRPSAPDR